MNDGGRFVGRPHLDLRRDADRREIQEDGTWRLIPASESDRAEISCLLLNGERCVVNSDYVMVFGKRRFRLIHEEQGTFTGSVSRET